MSEEADRAAAAKRHDVVEAAEKGDLPAVRHFVRQNRAAALSAKNRYGVTALMRAAADDHLDVVHFLLEAKADVDVAKDDGRTALHCAAYEGHLRSAELLVAAGASLDVKDKDGDTPLDDARSQGHDNVVKLLESAAQKKVEAKAATGGYTAKVPEAKPSAAPIAAKAKSGAEPPAADASPTRKGLDVRTMRWYSHYLHSIYMMIDSCFDEEATGIVMVGLQPTIDREMTCLEWPCLQQDLRLAFQEEKHPFFSGGKKRLEFDDITFKRVRLEDLGEELEVSTRRGKYAIIASCTDTHFEAAATAMREHNRRALEGHGKVRKAWATANDEYGRPTHP